VVRPFRGPFRYFVVYKPFGLLSQFTPDHPGQRTLADLFRFPPAAYPVGRLDQDSEGLLLITDDNQLKTKLLDPESKVSKRYLVQVEGRATPDLLKPASEGMSLRIRGKDLQLAPARVQCLDHEPALPPREPPVRFRKTVPDSWVEITITEGKNRQVRKMLAALGFPVLRLVRIAIGGLTLNDMLQGEVKEISDPWPVICQQPG
jgi:23S rRNA pseudouridine2457 synthase